MNDTAQRFDAATAARKLTPVERLERNIGRALDHYQRRAAP